MHAGRPSTSLIRASESASVYAANTGPGRARHHCEGRSRGCGRFLGEQTLHLRYAHVCKQLCLKRPNGSAGAGSLWERHHRKSSGRRRGGHPREAKAAEAELGGQRPTGPGGGCRCESS